MKSRGRRGGREGGGNTRKGISLVRPRGEKRTCRAGRWEGTIGTSSPRRPNDPTLLRRCGPAVRCAAAAECERFGESIAFSLPILSPLHCAVTFTAPFLFIVEPCGEMPAGGRDLVKLRCQRWVARFLQRSLEFKLDEGRREVVNNFRIVVGGIDSDLER